MKTHSALKSFLFRKTLVTSALLLSFFFGSKSSSGFGNSSRHVVSLSISRDPQRAILDLKTLSQFDVLGVDRKNHTAQVQVSGSELAQLQALGFSIDFSPTTLGEQNTEDLEKYMPPSQVEEFLHTMTSKYPKLAKVIEIGKTRRGNAILGIELSSDLNDDKRPAVLFNGMHHARELMTTEVTVHLIETLLENYENDKETKHWLDNYKILVVPQVNPDGNQIVHDGKPLWRKNAWSPQEQLVGVDINRNYPTDWGACNGSSASKSADTYRGPSAGSEPEVQAMMSLVQKYRPVMNISYHSYSELIIYPFGCANRKNSSAELFKNIGLAMRAQVQNDSGKTNTYDVGPAPEVIYEADGTDIDWQWKEEGVLSFAYEVTSRRLGFQPNYAQWRDVTVKRQEGGWKEMLRQMDKSGVRGILQPQENSDEATFVVRRIQNSQKFLWAGEQGIAPFKARNTGGLLYQILQPGEYELEFSTPRGKTKTIRVNVGTGMLDLGTIAL